MTRDAKDPIYLVDASIYVFRAWFSLPDTLTDSNGDAANAVHGFCDFMLRFLRRVRPHHVVFLFDESFETSYRNEIYPPYKANREPAPEELKAQFRYCRELVAATGINEIADGRYEADDFIGTLADRAHADGRPVIVVTGDKDLTQVLRRGDLWWDYSRDVKLGCADVADRFGVFPEQIADLLAIAGDPVDNVPGAPGIGPVTAARLLQHFGSLGHLLDNVSEISSLRIRGAQRIEGLVREYSETIRLSYRLTTLNRDAPVPPGFRTAVAPGDTARIESLCDLLGFSAYRRRQWHESSAQQMDAG